MKTFTSNVLWDAYNAFHRTIKHPEPFTFYDYLGEFPKMIHDGYELDDHVYEKMMYLHSPHATTIVKAWIAKNESK